MAFRVIETGGISMEQAKLYYFDLYDEDRPIECKFITNFAGDKKYFESKENALLYLFDNGLRTYQYLT